MWQGSEYASDFAYVTVLNIAGLWICFWFWICQGSGYTTVSNKSGWHMVLNIPE